MSQRARTEDWKATGERIPGYDYGKPASARSPLSLEELRQLEEAAGWTAEDAAALARHPEVFVDRAEAMVDSWRAVIASQPHLIKWFFGPDGKPDQQYMAKVKPRFVQWVRDVAMRPHDKAWLDYQEEIGLRHTPAKKNVTDGAHTPDLVPLRYVVGMAGLISLSARKFFVEAGISGDELQRLEYAWTKAVILHVSLWCRPYVKDGLW
jgi:hypothetical protein